MDGWGVQVWDKMSASALCVLGVQGHGYPAWLFGCHREGAEEAGQAARPSFASLKGPQGLVRLEEWGVGSH